MTGRTTREEWRRRGGGGPSSSGPWKRWPVVVGAVEGEFFLVFLCFYGFVNYFTDK